MGDLRLLNYILAFFICFISHLATAQLKDCNAFLKGAYVEVGINWNGAYGSSAEAPSGYHPKGGASIRDTSLCGSTCVTAGLNLGFVADPDKDGWAVGSPAYFGDYFLPGNPQEGWSIQVDSLRADAWNVNGCGGSLITTGLNGSNISVFTVGGVRRAIWQGVFDSVQITQVTSLDSLDAFFNVHVILKNLSHKTLNNIYYLRTVDPDNDEPDSGGSFTTNNKVVYQQPNALNAALVSATSLYHHQAYLALGTQDSFAKCFIIKGSLAPHSVSDTGKDIYGLDSMYGRFGGLGDTSYYLYSDSAIADEGIGLVFKIGTLTPNPTDSVIISYAYIFGVSPGDRDSALSSTTSPWSLDTSHHTNTFVNQLNNTAENIKTYPNPFKNELTITGCAVGDKVVIYDNVGKVVESFVLSNMGSNSLNLHSLLAGLYVLQLTDKYGTVVKNIPLQKY